MGYFLSGASNDQNETKVHRHIRQQQTTVYFWGSMECKYCKTKLKKKRQNVREILLKSFYGVLIEVSK